MRMWRVVLMVGFVFVCRFVGAEESMNHAADIELEITPDHVEIGSFYKGMEVAVEGMMPNSLDVVIVCQGRDESLELKKKGKVWGILWMNVGDFVFEHVPSLYLLLSSKKLTAIAPQEVLDHYGLGYPALFKQVSCSEPDDQQRLLFNEMVKLKEKDRLFMTGEGSVYVKASLKNLQKIRGRFWLPPKAPPGEYEVRMMGFFQGQMQVQTKTPLVVERNATITYIATTAENRGLLYGLVSVVFAICAGLLTAFLFIRRSRKPY